MSPVGSRAFLIQNQKPLQLEENLHARMQQQTLLKITSSVLND